VRRHATQGTFHARKKRLQPPAVPVGLRLMIITPLNTSSAPANCAGVIGSSRNSQASPIVEIGPMQATSAA